MNLNGLKDNEVLESRKKYGTNELSREEAESLFSMFIGAFHDPWIMVLCGALILRLILVVLGVMYPQLSNGNDAMEIFSIILAITLSTGFSTVSEYRNTSRSNALQEEYSKTYAKIMRNGKLVTLLTSDIVKNDVILVQAGDKIPADGIIIEGNIKVSQAALNGEPRDEKKIAADDLKEADSTDFNSLYKVFMGSVVTSGEAYMVATVLGDATELGIINKSLTENNGEERMSTSSLKLAEVAKMIGKMGTAAAAIACILQIVLNIMHAEGSITPVFVFLLITEALMFGASIIIMAVPEGLPMMNSMVQAMNTESMYKKHILVRHNASFSDSAYMDILFSDKTGTITKGNLSLVEFITGNGRVIRDKVDPDFMEAITLNNLAKVSSENTAIGSNNMDRALLTYALNHGYHEDPASSKKIKEVSGFDSEKKCATAELKDGTVYWKGATETILDRITHYIDENGAEQPFSNKEDLLNVMKTQTERTMKLLSVAKIEKEKIILLSVLCLRDDVRPDAVETVHTLNKAGIQVVMVTGDAKETAVAIAKEAGILTKDTDIALTHEELEELTDEELKGKMNDLRVISRAKPMDKRRLVSISQSMEHVVGMSGDGVNDAPALKQADVGFAMGDGTAVAQEAGDIVILNNSLTSIKDCVLNSRTMAKSVGKFLIFQLTVNVATLVMNILAPILGWTEPFSIVEILWINLIMDTLAALAFGGEPILDRYMDESPAKRTDNILTKYIKSAIGVSAAYITCVSIFVLENIGGILNIVRPVTTGIISDVMNDIAVYDFDVYDKTFMFACFIYAIIFNSLNTRSETWNLFEHIGENKRFIIVMGGIFIMQTALLQFGGAVFETTPLTLKGYLFAILLGAMIIPVDMIRKAVVNKISHS